MKFGYTRVSTRDQNLEAQLDALTAAGCAKIIIEELQQRGVEFVSLKDHIDTSSAIGKAMFRMLAGLQTAHIKGQPITASCCL